MKPLLTKLQKDSIALKRSAIASRIKEALKAENIQKQEFAELMGVQPSIVSRWLTGRHNFTIKTVFAIEQVLGISIFYIKL